MYVVFEDCCIDLMVYVVDNNENNVDDACPSFYCQVCCAHEKEVMSVRGD